MAFHLFCSTVFKKKAIPFDPCIAQYLTTNAPRITIMPEPLVSIIIPFYNEERYLERAVRSALNQTYQPVEIILVDDGSDDGSSSIAALLAQQQEHVSLFTTPHHSIGRARNIGVQQSSGHYIAYLDSDDELEPDAIEKLVLVMEQGAIDAVVGGFGMYTVAGVRFKSAELLPALLHPGEAAAALCKERIARVVWGKLFKAGICRQMAFPEGIWFEDGPYLMAYFCRCQGQIAISKDTTVRHYCRPDSVTRQQVSAKRISDTFTAFEIEWGAIKNDNGIKAQVFSYYQRALMNNLVMLAMDRQQVSADLQQVYLQTFAAFVKRKHEAGIVPGPRTRLNILLMASPKWIGWRLFYLLFPLFKPGLFRKVAAIRSLGRV
jgi:glycosyltransferase involved in cell wall biosynthesis